MAADDADPIWELIMERARVGSRPGCRADGARLALAVEGGGMAGTVSAGMCVALEALGLIASFDVIYGSSAGALNASYTAAGQARTRARLYADAAAAGVVSPRRALRGHPPFRLAELVEGMLRAHPHDARVLDDRPALRITATRCEDKQLEVLADFASVDEIRQAVWASCAIPILAGDVVEFRGCSYVDGGLAESLPYGVALREGATHVLLLRARHADARLRPYGRLTRRAIDHMMRDAPETVVELLRERPARYNAEVDALRSARLEGRVSQLAPVNGAGCPGVVETRPDRLGDGIRLGMHAVQRAARARRR
jgi:predicted patatin/cPLA2 family phospholipase